MYLPRCLSLSSLTWTLEKFYLLCIFLEILNNIMSRASDSLNFVWWPLWIYNISALCLSGALTLTKGLHNGSFLCGSISFMVSTFSRPHLPLFSQNGILANSFLSFQHLSSRQFTPVGCSQQQCIGGGLVTKSCPTIVTPWTVACRAPLSMGFSRQEYWRGLTFPSPGDLPDPGI